MVETKGCLEKSLNGAKTFSTFQDVHFVDFTFPAKLGTKQIPLLSNLLV